MEIVCIERIAWEQLKQRISRLADQLARLSKIGSNDDWLDSSDVCRILDISKCTLQSYRTNGKMPFSMIGGKVYFRESDIAAMLQKQLKQQ